MLHHLFIIGNKFTATLDDDDCMRTWRVCTRVYVCVCVCVRERERERESARARLTD